LTRGIADLDGDGDWFAVICLDSRLIGDGQVGGGLVASGDEAGFISGGDEVPGVCGQDEAGDLL